MFLWSHIIVFSVKIFACFRFRSNISTFITCPVNSFILWDEFSVEESVIWAVSVKRRLQTGGKMQTAGKININNKKTSHKDKIKIVWKTILFYICQQLTLLWLQVAAPFGDAIVRVEIICALFLRFQMHCNVPNYLSHRYIEGNRSKNQQLLLRIPE